MRRIVKRIALATMSLLVASPALAGDASMDRDAALERLQRGAQAEERAPATEQSRATGQEGSLVEVSQSHIVLRTPQGDDQSYEVGPSTEIRRGSSEVTISDVDAGEKAVVRAKSSSTGEPEATSISLASKSDSQWH
jgi:hypothetical protein